MKQFFVFNMLILYGVYKLQSLPSGFDPLTFELTARHASVAPRKIFMSLLLGQFNIAGSLYVILYRYIFIFTNKETDS